MLTIICILLEVKGHEVEGASLALHAEVECFLFAEAFRERAAEAFFFQGSLYGNTKDGLTVLLRSYGNSAAVAIALEVDSDFFRIPEIEILEAYCAVRAEVGNILVRSFFAVRAF